MDLIKEEIKSKAYELGFSYCGFSKAGFLEEEAQNWKFGLNKITMEK